MLEAVCAKYYIASCRTRFLADGDLVFCARYWKG